MKKVYLASGWFNPNQERRVREAEEVLRGLGFDVFSPREHQHPQYEYMSKEWREATFKSDVDHVDWCDFIFAVYDEEDSGTMWEVGYTYGKFGKEKPIIIYHETDGLVNLMISDSLTAYLKNWEDVKKYDFVNFPKVPYEGEIV
jgi:nucleoside 2-deoxyribosyltransferase